MALSFYFLKLIHFFTSSVSDLSSRNYPLSGISARSSIVFPFVSLTRKHNSPLLIPSAPNIYMKCLPTAEFTRVAVIPPKRAHIFVNPNTVPLYTVGITSVVLRYTRVKAQEAPNLPNNKQI